MKIRPQKGKMGNTHGATERGKRPKKAFLPGLEEGGTHHKLKSLLRGKEKEKSRIQKGNHEPKKGKVGGRRNKRTLLDTRQERNLSAQSQRGRFNKGEKFQSKGASRG